MREEGLAPEDHDVRVKIFPVGALQCNCAILAWPSTGQAIVIDPGGDEERIEAILEELGVSPTIVLHTHAHLDHLEASVAVGALGRTADGEASQKAPLALHEGDSWLWDNVELQARTFGLRTPETAPIDHWLEHEEQIPLGKTHLKVLHTPGHTPGSSSFLFQPPGSQPMLFSGDTLFAGSIGRTDLWGGDFDLIIRSIKERLLLLDDETVVVPGHGPISKIGREAAVNPFVGEGAR